MTVARKKYITKGTPLRKPPGLLKAFTPPMMSKSASPTAIVSAAILIRRVDGDTGQSHGAENHGKPARGNVDHQEH
jgi:hypothetical protein